MHRSRARTTWPFVVGFLLLALAACSPTGPGAFDLEGRLLDVDGEPVAGAVAFVPGASASAAGAEPAIAVQQTATCQAPSESAAVSACTDAQGRFALRVTAPPSGTLRLVFERLYWRAEAVVDLTSRPAGRPVGVPDTRFAPLEPDEELDRAIRFALPGLGAFSTIRLDDEATLKVLEGHAGGGTGAGLAPATVQLPIRHPDGEVETIAWLAYHRNLRGDGIEDCALDADTLAATDCRPLDGPSRTFQGVPQLGDAEIERLRDDLDGFAKALEDEGTYQLSVLALVGDELDASYYGARLRAPHTPSTLQGLRGLLSGRYGADAARRLLADDGPNYLLYNQIDYDLASDDDEVDVIEGAGADASGAPVGAAAALAPSAFLGALTPFMAADPTVYDAISGQYLVDDYHARVEAMANRQDMFFWALQFHDVTPPSFPPPLPAVRNGFSVRTVIVGYRRLSVLGQAQFSFPANECGSPTPNLLSRYRQFSPNSRLLPGEYWVWWTRTDRYPNTLGCAGVAGFGATPRNGGTAWVRLDGGTLEATAATLMHETGHLLNGLHERGANPQRCRLFGALPIGVEGPSLMITGVDRTTRTLCFAPTPSNTTTVRNTSRVAAHLARFLP